MFKGIFRRLAALEAFTAQLNSADSEEVVASESTSSTGYTNLTTPGPTATVNAGLSGKVSVAVMALISIGTGATGVVGLYVDGSLYFDGIAQLGNNSGGSISCTAAGTIVVPSLSVGSHTFELKYKTSSGAVPATFANRVVTAEPI